MTAHTHRGIRAAQLGVLVNALLAAVKLARQGRILIVAVDRGQGIRVCRGEIRPRAAST
jgi:hypothetical protein